MSDRPYGVLVHGAGWVSTQHLAAFARNPCCEVVAVSSRRLASAQARAAEQGLTVACYDDYQAALAHPGVDIVVIATPQQHHAQNVIDAARAGKHLVIEKPVACSLDELRQMRDAVRGAGVASVVSFVLRWNPLFETIKALIADGAVGTPYCVECDYQSNFASWWPGFEEARRADLGVSALLVGGCHAVDAVRWFAAPGQSEAAVPSEVFAWSGGWRKGATREYNYLTNRFGEGPPLEYDGLEIALVKFTNGVLGKVSVNADAVMPYRFPIRVFGDAGTILDNRVWSGKYPRQTDWVEIPTILPDSSDVSHHPFEGQINHFVETLRAGQRSHCDLDDAVLTHEIVFGARQSTATGQPVRLPLI
ncbi:MAG: Gfo/Idh/MocA family oxidoreductase [Fimbriimonadaceae bacterium]|nr:Gfo/Idh/MocA family oxidoreductase [Fimbriimonadaceae bacterium]